jgi:hypothetical protein
MRRYMIPVSAAALATPLFLLLACAGTPRPRKLHPDFRPERVRPLVMLMDVGLLHDVPGDVDELRVHEGLSVADSLAARFSAGLAVKNYRVERTMLTSMGLPWPPTWEFLTTTSPAQEALPSTEKPRKHPPFFTNDSLSRDVMTLTTVASMYREVRLARERKLKKKPSVPVASAPLLLKYLNAADSSDLLVLFLSGRDISKGKKAGNIFLEMIAIAATAAGNPPVTLPLDYGGVMLDAFIVDGRTGELLWSDSKLVEGQRANWGTVDALAHRVMTELPLARLRPVPVFGPRPPTPLPRTTASYDSLLARLRAGDLTIDYLSLRLAYAESPQYDPYDFRTDSKTAMRTAFAANDCQKALAIADSILTTKYVDIEGHIVSAECMRRQGEGEKARSHAMIAHGVLESIRTYASGRTPDSAIVVISIDEEYALLAAEGLERTTEALTSCGGHPCDAIEAVDRASGKTRRLYFNVGIPFGWFHRNLGKDSTARTP